jgi:tetratricopeptide (TPR) repeat protein
VLVAINTAAAQVLPPFDTTRLYLTEAAFTRAIQPYQQAITANRQDARAHYWLGYAYAYAFRQWRLGAAAYAAGYGERAVASLQEAIRLDGGLVPAYLVLHDVYRLMGQFDRAAEVLEQMTGKARPGWTPRMPVW